MSAEVSSAAPGEGADARAAFDGTDAASTAAPAPGDATNVAPSDDGRPPWQSEGG
jgi:hypothetical protein